MSRLLKSAGVCLCLGACLVFGGVSAFAAGAPTSEFGTNASGQTYGTGLFVETDPDLISAIGVDGAQGYVKAEDLKEPEPASPTQALADSIKDAFLIPLYASDGKTTLGSFEVAPMEKSLKDTVEVVPYGIAYSSYKNFTVSGISYQNRAATMTYSNLGNVQARVYIGRVSGSAAAGHLGYRCRLYNDSGVLLKASNYAYNDRASVGIEGYMDYSARSGAYYSSGYTKVWNSSTSSYSAEYSTYRSPSQSF